MKHRAILLLAGIAGASGCALAPPEPPGDVALRAATKYYDVVGRTDEEIFESLRKQALAAGDREDSHAVTHAQVTWNFEYHEAAAGGCRIARAHVDIAVETVLPRWQSPARASPRLKAQWERFIDATRVHEKGHFDLDVASANEVLKALRSMPQDDCNRIKDDAEQVGKVIVDRYRALNEKYDADTDHGILQGTVWQIEGR